MGHVICETKVWQIVPVAISCLHKPGLSPLQGQFTKKTRYLALKGPIEVDNTATVKTMPLEDVLQFFVACRNKSPDRPNAFGLAMLQQRLNQFATDAQPPLVWVNKYSVNNAHFS